MNLFQHEREIPVALKRDIVDNWLRAKRATEEIASIESEMIQVESYYHNILSRLDSIYSNLMDESSSPTSKYNDGLLNIVNRKKQFHTTVLEKLKAQFRSYNNVTSSLHHVDLDALEEMYFPLEDDGPTCDDEN